MTSFSNTNCLKNMLYGEYLNTWQIPKMVSLALLPPSGALSALYILIQLSNRVLIGFSHEICTPRSAIPHTTSSCISSSTQTNTASMPFSTW